MKKQFYYCYPSRDAIPAIADYSKNFFKAIQGFLDVNEWNIIPIETDKFKGFSQKPGKDDIFHFEISHLDRKTFELAYQVINDKSHVILTLHDIPDTVKSPSKIAVKNHFWLKFNLKL